MAVMHYFVACKQQKTQEEGEEEEEGVLWFCSLLQIFGDFIKS